MNQSLLVQLTHANYKTSIYLTKQTMFSWYFSEAQKCTMVIATGGAMIPVLESPKEVGERYSSAVPAPEMQKA